jgi:hypothetical protein
MKKRVTVEMAEGLVKSVSVDFKKAALYNEWQKRNRTHGPAL